MKKFTPMIMLSLIMAMILILSILVDTFFARISLPKQQYPEIHNISAA